MGMNDTHGHGYLLAGYYKRVLISFLAAVAVIMTILFRLPPSDQYAPEHGIKNVVIDLYALSLEESSAQGGGGGGGSRRPDDKAPRADLQRHAMPTPVPTAAADSSVALAQTDGPGEGIGGGGGQGGGYGSGRGDGIGDGVGRGRGFAAPDTLPPRPLVQVMPEHPRSGPDRKAVGSVRLKIRVNDRGEVDQVEVVLNTTGSTVCEQKAVEAALQSRYQPARVQLKSVAAWTMIEYGFNNNSRP